MASQFDLFGARERDETPAPAYPDGFLYRAELIDEDEERRVLEHVRQLPFREFQFHGFTGKRRTVSFGWRYDFAAERLDRTDDLPPWLLALRERAAGFAALEPESLQQVLVTEYDAGAGIGWHRDKAVFGEVVGISLLAPCTFRLRRALGDRWERWERVNLVAEARSAYLLSGAARTEWEHSIPPVDALRYSITFRNLRRRQA